MRIQTKRIFMNEADGSPGGGAAAASPAAPTAAPTAPETPPTSIVDQVASLIDSKLKAFENGFFANARRAGVLKKDEPAAPAAPPAAAPASTGLSADDVKAMIARENAIARVSTESKLTSAQEKWMRDLVEASKPDDVLGYCKSFVTDLGIVRPAEPSTPAIAPVQPAPGGPPLSDKGSPAPGGVVNWEREFAENPGFMSAAARAAMDAKYGPEKARRMRIEAVNAPGGQAERLRVVTKP